MNPMHEPLVLDPPKWLFRDIPILHEDEEDNDMGEANLHIGAIEILHICLTAHLLDCWPALQVFANMNCYFDALEEDQRVTRASVCADTMAVEPFKRLPEDIKSYKIGEDGPAPRIACEVLSESTAEKRDKTEKADIYARLGVEEYILVDPTGEFLKEKLLLKRLQPDGTWKDERDDDGGVTSKYGFRLIFDEQDQLAVIDLATGRRYVRPMEAEAEAKARRIAEARAEAEAERAQVEAERAQVEAERAQVEAERAQVEAERARVQAELAQAESERANSEAERAQAESERAEAETQRAEAETQRAEAETQRAEAEGKARRAADKARRLAEERTEKEVQARRLLEEQLKALQAELDGLRQPHNNKTSLDEP